MAVGRASAATAPDVVFHLAGRTPPAAAEDYYRDNTLATVHLLDALRGPGRAVRVVLAGSAAELGPLAAEDLPVAEEYHGRPVDGYGLAQASWRRPTARAARPPLEVITARIFNPIGPGLPRSQAFGRFAALLAEPGTGPIRLTVGDLDACRDFIDVRDVARALLSLARGGEPGSVYHVGTGQSHRVGDGLDHLIHLSGRDVTVEVSPELNAPRETATSRRCLRARHSTAGVAATGWRPEVGWHQSLEDLWDEARRGACAPVKSDLASVLAQ